MRRKCEHYKLAASAQRLLQYAHSSKSWRYHKHERAQINLPFKQYLRSFQAPAQGKALGSQAQGKRGAHKILCPPWPIGQGVGLLMRRLRVQVPQGVLLHQRRAAAHGSAPWRSCLVTRQHVLACFRAARLGADGSDHDYRERHSCARRPSPLSRPARLVTFRVIQRPVAATEDIGALRANPGDEHCPVFSCIKHVTIVLSLVCACSSGAATEVGPCLARAGGSRALRARGKLHVLSGSGRESEEPPWPNGQGADF